MKWEVQFGIKVSECDPSTKKVCAAMCLFCAHFGREENNLLDNGQERKRKRTDNPGFFLPPWRSDNIKRHMTRQHPQMWERYKVLNDLQKGSFFKTNTAHPEAVTMRSFVRPAEANPRARIASKQKCSFVIDSDIVTDIIGDLLFDPDEEAGDDEDEELAKERALKMFKKENEDDEFHVVTARSVLKLKLIVSYISVGVSFCQATRIYQSTKEETGLGLLGNIHETEVMTLCRTVCAVNLQSLKEIAKHVWAFSIGLDGWQQRWNGLP